MISVMHAETYSRLEGRSRCRGLTLETALGQLSLFLGGVVAANHGSRVQESDANAGDRPHV